MDNQEVLDFLTNIPDSQFQAAATEQALKAKKRMEATKSLQKEYQEKKHNVLRALGTNEQFKWFVQNELLPFSVPQPLFTADLDGRQKYDVIRADIYRNLVSDILENMRRD